MRILYLPNAYSQQRQRDVKAKIYPVLMAMEAEYYRQRGHDVKWTYHEGFSDWEKTETEGSFDKVITEPEGLPFLDLPVPDRKFTRYQDYQDNGNFKYLPATYIQAARDCWYHQCSFCAWAKKYPVCETRSVVSVISEINECVKLGFREIFDDSGTFPVGDWLKSFCQSMIDTGLNKEVTLGCNMRFGALDLEDFDLMKQAGFRMILWGLESVNQSTLDRLSKGIRVEQILPDLYFAKRVGLESHVAAMIGYPWETKDEAFETINFIKRLLIKGYAETAQMSFYDAPEGQEKGNEEFRKYKNKIYEVGFNPKFWYRKIIKIRSIEDFEYLIKGVKKGLGGLCRGKLITHT